jgi:hypothetical protein
MRYEARITAFDVLDRVHIAVAIYEADPIPQTSSRLVATRVTSVPGTGESDPFQWTRDALVAALEDL